MKSSEYLKQVKARIQDPNDWCQGWFAKTRDGTRVSIEDGSQWCAIGAMYWVNARDHNVTTGNYLSSRRHLERVMHEAIDVFNDHHTHAELMAAFDHAIAYAEKEESNETV